MRKFNLNSDFGRMSAIPPKADICSAIRHVRFGPIADIDALGQLQYIPRHLGSVSDGFDNVRR